MKLVLVLPLHQRRKDNLSKGEGEARQGGLIDSTSSVYYNDNSNTYKSYIDQDVANVLPRFAQMRKPCFLS